MGCSDSFLGMNGMMQRLTQHRQTYAIFGNRRIFDVANAVLQVLEAVFLCQLPAELDHFWGIIDSDDLTCVFREQLRSGPLACAEGGDCQWRQQSNERMRQRFPGATRHVTPTKLARQ